MKKVSLLVLICMLASIVMTVLVGCDDEVVHTHAYGEEWVMDGTNHYHVCECGAKSDSAEHADENNDGACDTCAVIMAHDHVFDPAWTADATNHWHAVLCGHDVEVEGKAAHTPDDLGKCTVCGYKVSEPDVSTVEKALTFAAKAQSVVLGGKYALSSTYFNQDASFEYGDGYIHVVNGAEHLYVTKNADGTVCVVESATDGFATVDKASTEVQYLNGPAMNLQQIIDADQTVYGILELLAFFYEDFTAMAPEGTEVVVTEAIENGVYSFSYSFTIPSAWAYMPASTYTVAVNFTLDEENYFIDNVTATINKNSGMEEVYTFVYDQWIVPTSSHTPADITPTEAVKFEYNYSPVEFDENGVAPTINITLGYPTFQITICDFTSSNALVEALGIGIAFVNGEDTYHGASYTYDPAEKCITVTIGEWVETAANFDMVITVGEETYTFPVELAYASSYGIGIYEGDGWSGFNPFDVDVVYTGAEILLYGYAGQGTVKNAYTASIIDGPATDALTLAANNGLGEYEQYKNKTYIFQTYIPGVYTIEFATIPAEEGMEPLTATAMVVVLETTPSAANTAVGKWEISATGMSASVNFYPQDEENTKGVALAKVTARGSEQVVVFTYYIHEGQFVATPVGTTTMMIQSLTIDSNYNVVLNEADEYASIALERSGNTTDAWDVDTLGEQPVAPGYVDPNATTPVEVYSGLFMAYDSPLVVEQAGTGLYTATIPAGGAYLVVACPAAKMEPGTWTGNWLLTITVDGAVALVDGAAAVNLPFNDANYQYLVNFTNDGTDPVDVTIKISVAEITSLTGAENTNYADGCNVSEAGTTAYQTTIAAGQTVYFKVEDYMEGDENNYTLDIVAIGEGVTVQVYDADANPIDATTGISFNYMSDWKYFISFTNTTDGEVTVTWTVTVTEVVAGE